MIKGGRLGFMLLPAVLSVSLLGACSTDDRVRRWRRLLHVCFRALRHTHAAAALTAASFVLTTLLAVMERNATMADGSATKTATRITVRIGVSVVAGAVRRLGVAAIRQSHPVEMLEIN